MSGSYFQPIKREFLNLSGGTVTGDTVFTQGLYANSLSGGTLYSGSTNLADIFLTSVNLSAITVSEGTNISLQNVGDDYKISVVDSPYFNDINFSGTSIGGNSIATNVSATTSFYSAGTSLETIIYNIAGSNVSGVKIQPGSNILTGGTEGEPIISLIASPSINNLSFSGTAIGGNLSANVLSGGTIYSGSTELGSLIYNVVSSITNSSQYLPISGGTGGPYNLTGSTTASTLYASTLIEPTADDSVDAGTTFKRFRSLNSVNGIAVNFTASTRMTTPEIVLGTTTITENNIVLSGYTLEGGSW